ADAHVKGVEYLLEGGETSFFNLGNGSGFTVREVIEMARKVTGKEIVAVECDRRPGDPPSLVGTSERAQQVLGWQPKYPDIENIITHAWQWHQKRHSR
ncbi:MAG: UDP-glucose 4-epimerase GalE, partial [Cyanobacteria bacterium J06560_2]